MYEQFTDRARKVMQLANQEAQRFNNEYIGTEHLLLGLVREGSGAAAGILANMGVDLRKIRLEVEKLSYTGPVMVTMGKLPQTPRAKKVIEHAMATARAYGHGHVGTEHVLVGLAIEQEGVAANVLHNLGVTLDALKKAFESYVGYSAPKESTVTNYYNDELRERSGSKRTSDPLTSFMYELVRDHLPAGVVEKIVQNVLNERATGEDTIFTNGWLASYAGDIADRLRVNQ